MLKNAIKLTLDDSRRLTGKSLLWERPGAIIDAFVEGIDQQKVIEVWQKYARQLLDGVGWQNEGTAYRQFEDGVSLAISAPMDALYAATEINEAAWYYACRDLSDEPVSDAIVPDSGPGAVSTEDHKISQSPAEEIKRLSAVIADEVNPQLIQIMALAKENNAPCLVDDDVLSLGYGKTSESWPVNDLPKPETLDWEKFKAVPLALITGTNGKSTSVRILAGIIKQAGKICGVTSTDFIRIGDNVLDRGDYSGPGGARRLLRHPETEAAVLEVARGGILRRGLPVDRVDAALITNVAEDHLGQYGINTVEALAEAKAVVAKALVTTDETEGQPESKPGTLVLNAEDANLVRLAPSLPGVKCWFSLDENNAVLQKHKAGGGKVCFVKKDDNGDESIYYSDGGDAEAAKIIAVKDIPMTLNGAARHNILNALGATAMAKAMAIEGLDNQAISRALSSFNSNLEDNPGRGNQFIIDGAQIIMDFAHNVHGMDAMAVTTANIKARKKYLMLSHAGDRSNRDISEMTKAALKMKPDYVVAVELKDYLRGRAPGEVPQLIADTAKTHGIPAENVFFADGPCAGAKLIIDKLQSDDLALLMVLSERDEVTRLLKEKAGENS